MNKRLILTGILLGTLMMSTLTYAGVKNVIVDNKLIQLDGEENTLYPLRKLCESLGIEISRVTEEHIVLNKGGNVVTLNRNNRYLKNTKGYFAANTMPIQKNGQTYVGLEVLEKMFGCNILLTDAATIINKATTFNIPESTEAGKRLYNDLNYIELLEEKIDINYYRASVQTGIKNYDMETIAVARQKLAHDLTIIGEVEAYLKSNSGKAVVKGYKELFNAYELILNNALNLDVRNMIQYLIGIMEAEDHVKLSKNNFTKVLEKNAGQL